MKERPILFNGEMVRAILEGRKTQTRRVVKGIALEWLAPGMFSPGFVAHPENSLSLYGKIGDRPWVRETCRAEESLTGQDGVRYLADDRLIYIEDSKVAAERWLDLYSYRGGRGNVVPSIHMPRWASRLTLEITGVRVEQLRSISMNDIDAEGVGDMIEDPDTVAWAAFNEAEHYLIAGVPSAHSAEVWGFAAYWDSIAKPGEQWDDNPWVWVYEFRRLSAKQEEK